MQFNERFRDLILDKEISASELGRILNIKHATICLYLHNTYPSVANAIKIANFFNCSLNYLFGLDDFPDEIDFCKENIAPVFYERYSNILQIKNISHYQLAKDLELGNNNLRNWKSGKIPNTQLLTRIAKYLNCSIDYLVGRSKEIRWQVSAKE